MATFPSKKQHARSRRQLSRGEQLQLQGGMLAGQNLAVTDLGFASSRGVPVASIFVNPTCIGGVGVVAGLYEVANTPSLTVSDSSGVRTPAQLDEVLVINPTISLGLWWFITNMGAVTVTLAPTATHSARMAMRMAVITGLGLNANEDVQGNLGANSQPICPLIGSDVANTVMVSCLGMNNPPPNTAWQEGFRNIGGPVDFAAPGAQLRLVVAYQIFLQAVPLGLRPRVNGIAGNWAISTGVWK